MVVAGGDCLDALDLVTGARLWQQKLRASVRRFLVAEDRVFVLTAGGEVVCFALQSGAPIGGVVAVDSGEALLHRGGILYVVGYKSVAAIDPRGQLLWTQQLEAHHHGGLRGAGIFGQVMQPDYDTNTF